MKLIITALAGISMIVASSLPSAATVVIRKGHPTGTYEKVTENDAMTELTCSGDGSKACQWSDGAPGKVIFVNNVQVSDAAAGQIVQQKVNNHIYQGTVNGDRGIGYYSWYVDQVNGIIYTFDDGKK